MKELSIFVEESGDLGEYDYRAPYYIISMVFHDQNYDMNKELEILEESLTHIGWSKHCVHAGPVIRSEEEYKGYSIKDRQDILKRRLVIWSHWFSLVYNHLYALEAMSLECILLFVMFSSFAAESFLRYLEKFVNWCYLVQNKQRRKGV